ncbi:MAG: DUF1573 domain-containing protein [Rikenellaceae bacterium]|nr:DUF1573 domain-containing protein [Rikenellaceae bacterium]
MVVAVQCCNAQGGLAFKTQSFDFGTISVTDSIVACEFEFYNRSSKILIINKIESSCSCVSVDYKAQPLRMGESGTIRVRFNPKNQQGRFYKPIYVYHNSSKQPTELIVRGVVSAEISSEFLYPYQLCEIVRANAESLNLGYAVHGRFAIGKLELYNSGNECVTVEEGSRLPENIRLKIDLTQIAPEQRMCVGVIYEAADTNVWGTVNHKVSLKINGSEVWLPISVVVVEDFSSSADNQGEQAPKLSLDHQLLHLGEVGVGSRHKRVVRLKNEGGNDLIIRKINMSNQSISASVSVASHTLKSRQHAELEISVKCDDVGRFNEYIELITNDSHRPMRRVRVVANVVK